jgi:small subunit ribosomal protein S5
MMSCASNRTVVGNTRVAIAAPKLSSVHAIGGRALLPQRPENISYINRQENMRIERSRVVGVEAAKRDGDRFQQQSDGFQDRVIQVRRVTKVVKGGKQLRFRAVVVVGNENGTVGVGCASAKEVVTAVQKAAVDAKRNLVTVPLSKSSSFPHRFDGVFGAARVMLRPAAEGTGVIAGGAVRTVLELAGVKNGFGKQLGSDNPLNNAKATVEGLKNMRTFKDVAAQRGVPLEYLLPAAAKSS